MLSTGWRPRSLDRNRSIDVLAETVVGLFESEVIGRLGPWRCLEAVEFATLALGLLPKAAASLSDGFAAARNGSTGSITGACSPLGFVPRVEADAAFYDAREREPTAA